VDSSLPVARPRPLNLLTETAPETPMGRLLRTFWHPIAIADSVASGSARGLKILGEELTLYRGESGTPHLVGGRCAHRCTLLHTGWVQGEQIRCMYHGWRYDATGQCTELPAERLSAIHVKIAGYPLHEYCGLIFAYFGEAPPPEFDLPRKEALEQPGNRLIIQEMVWDCNWFQQVENSLDAVHVSFVHMWGEVGRFGAEISTMLPELRYEETSAGIRQTATRAKNNVRVSDWTFPNNNHILAAGLAAGDPWYHTSVWVVPIDDERTLRFRIAALPASGESVRMLADDPHRDYNPAHFHEELFEHHRVPASGQTTGLAASQDYVSVRGQGTIVNRTNERLVSSDAGIALQRRIAFREMEAIQDGRATKRWHRHNDAVRMSQPGEETGGFDHQGS
jgi:5,5'-dehydrodivanillate O-demethylase